MPEKNLKLKTQNSKVQVKSKKLVAKKVVKIVSEKTVKPALKTVKTTAGNLTVSVYGLDGKSTSKITLPKEIFGEIVNKKLLAQAVRVYLANKRQGNASTKTRGEVEGSTRKIYRQKGTGNARHGSIRAPIFVKGGIVHGPKPRDFGLDLSKKMKRKALFSALSAKLADGDLKIISGFEKIAPKTKQFISVLEKLSIDNKNLPVGKAGAKILIVKPDNFENVYRASRNLQGIESTSVLRLNALDILRNKHLLLTKESIAEMEKKFLKKN